MANYQLARNSYLYSSLVRRQVARSKAIVRTFSRGRLNSIAGNRVVIRLLTAGVAHVRTQLIVTKLEHQVCSVQRLVTRG